jgi:hypothetical protein
MAWPGKDDDLAPDLISSGSEDSGAPRRWSAALGGPRRAWRQARQWAGRSWAGRIAGGLVLIGAVAALGVLLSSSHPASHQPASASATDARHPAPVTISSQMPGRVRAGGVFATGKADGSAWQLALQDIDDPGTGCQPAVTLNGSDADPLFPDPVRLTPIGNPAFMRLGTQTPGVGFAFVQVPANVTWVWLDPKTINGLSLGMQPVTIGACGQGFHLVGFAYPLSGTLRIYESSPSRGRNVYTVPRVLSSPQPTLADPQVDGVWQDVDSARAQATIATLAAGRTFGQQWQIQLAFGTAGDCFTLNTSYLDDSAAAKASSTSFCGPVSTPRGPATIMALAIGAPAPDGLGVGYAVSVGPGTATLSAELSTGETFSVRPVAVGGRRYAAFFVPGPAHLTWLNGVDAKGQDVAGIQDLPLYGYIQYPL